jgi:hypothetical protein
MVDCMIGELIVGCLSTGVFGRIIITLIVGIIPGVLVGMEIRIIPIIINQQDQVNGAGLTVELQQVAVKHGTHLIKVMRAYILSPFSKDN